MPLNRLSLGPIDDYVLNHCAKSGELWLFIHIPKTAGTSLGGQLMRARPPARNVFVDYAARPEDRRSLGGLVDGLIGDGSVSRYRFMTGHFHMSHLAGLMAARSDLRMFTMLRDPLARIVSDYRYSTSPAHPLWQETRQRFPDLAAFAAANRNRMSRHLAPHPDMPPAELIAWLESRLSFVGIVDMYAKSLAMLGRLMGIRLDPGIRHNVTRADAAADADLPAALRDEVAELNATDLALYRHFRRRLAGVTLARPTAA